MEERPKVDGVSCDDDGGGDYGDGDDRMMVMVCPGITEFLG